MQAAEEHQGKQTRCPNCQSIIPIPVSMQSITESSLAPPIPVHAPPPVDPPLGLTEELPPQVPQYNVCPECHTPLEAEAILCIQCGFNRKTGKRLSTKIKRKKINKKLEPSPSVQNRMIVWAVLTGIPVLFFLFMVLTDFTLAEVLAFIFGWFMWALVWGLAWGSFSRAWIHRDAKQEIVIEKDHWVCFIPFKFLRQNIYPTDYEYLYINFRRGLSDTHQAFFLVLILLLLCMGAFPGLFFWWYVFHKETCVVELGNGFNKPSVVVFAGSQEGMNECVEELQEVAEHLTVERK